MNRFSFKSLFVLATLAASFFVLTGCGSDAKSESPEAAVKAALEKTSTITSGNTELKGALSIGSLPGSIAISGGGPFDTKAEGGPAFKIELELKIAGSPQKFGIAAVDGKNYLLVGDKAIEQKEKKGEAFDSGQIADFIKNLGSYITSAESSGENTYTATVDVKQLFADNAKKDGGLGNLSIPGLGSADQLTKSLESADISIEVDSEGYADVLDLNLPISTGGDQGGLRLTIDIGEINEPQTIEAPTDVVSDPSELGALGAAVGAGQ